MVHLELSNSQSLLYYKHNKHDYTTNTYISTSKQLIDPVRRKKKRTTTTTENVDGINYGYDDSDNCDDDKDDDHDHNYDDDDDGNTSRGLERRKTRTAEHHTQTYNSSKTALTRTEARHPVHLCVPCLRTSHRPSPAYIDFLM